MQYTMLDQLPYDKAPETAANFASMQRIEVKVGAYMSLLFFFFQAEDGIRDVAVTGVQTCALPIFLTSILPGKAAAQAEFAKHASPDKFVKYPQPEGTAPYPSRPEYLIPTKVQTGADRKSVV